MQADTQDCSMQTITGSLFDGSSKPGSAIYQNAQGGSWNQNAAGK